MLLRSSFRETVTCKVGAFWRKNVSESGNFEEAVSSYRCVTRKTVEIENKAILLSALWFEGFEYHKKELTRSAGV